MNELSRAEAKAQGLTRYFTGKPCKRGHVSERLTSNYCCVECKRPRERQACRMYYAANPEKFIARVEVYRKANLEKWAERKAKARVRKNGTSVELTPHQKHQVNQIYLLMRRLTLATGIQHHVDHYIPVTKGGSHAPENLWVIPAEQNMRKGSKLPVMAKVDSV